MAAPKVVCACLRPCCRAAGCCAATPSPSSTCSIARCSCAAPLLAHSGCGVGATTTTHSILLGRRMRWTERRCGCWRAMTIERKGKTRRWEMKYWRSRRATAGCTSVRSGAACRPRGCRQASRSRQEPETCDVILSHKSISREHAVLQLNQDGLVYLIDMASSHGSKINGVSVPPREYTHLAPGDIFTLGRASTAYRLIYTHGLGSNHREGEEDAHAEEWDEDGAARDAAVLNVAFKLRANGDLSLDQKKEVRRAEKLLKKLESGNTALSRARRKSEFLAPGTSEVEAARGVLEAEEAVASLRRDVALLETRLARWVLPLAGLPVVQNPPGRRKEMSAGSSEDAMAGKWDYADEPKEENSDSSSSKEPGASEDLEFVEDTREGRAGLRAEVLALEKAFSKVVDKLMAAKRAAAAG
ncbi:hypothetical protein T484DRAFT_1916010, partial [Baffinella frigidus]